MTRRRGTGGAPARRISPAGAQPGHRDETQAAPGAGTDDALPAPGDIGIRADSRPETDDAPRARRAAGIPVDSGGMLRWVRSLGSARAGLGATGVSIALTIAVAALGPSIMEPSLPGRAGQPPWAFAAHPSPYLAVALTVVALVLGTFGLAVTMRTARRGWSLSPRTVLMAGSLPFSFATSPLATGLNRRSRAATRLSGKPSSSQSSRM